MKKTLRLILGDQLNSAHSWFKEKNDSISYCMFEMRQETDYVTHHIQKVVGFFAAMRRFAEQLRSDGHKVIYYTLDQKDNHQQLDKNIRAIIKAEDFEVFEYMLPDEYRLDQQLQGICKNLDIESSAVDTEHFLTSRDELKSFFKDRKQYIMEPFYRYMRRKHDILMDGDDPLTGRWNYDAENRKKLAEDHRPPSPFTFAHDLTDIHKMVQQSAVQTIGNIEAGKFIWPLDRNESLQLLDFFVAQCLPDFGRYQDALSAGHWSLYHARLSFSLNTKMLSPKEVVDAAIERWHKDATDFDIAQLEGFVRQIIGWREYMRGIYWAKMPDYEKLNFFGHKNKLPDFFWTGDTKMACVSHAISQSLEYAYAHHIQRLMITGNFALVAGVDPDEVDAWYLGIYIDAIQWVELTNTRGMSQFADGGIVGTKPYISSANYINKMGHYCKDCHYKHTKKTGEDACPFNSLYWHFYVRNRKQLKDNHRVGMMYRNWDRMDDTQQQALLDQAEDYLERIDEI